MGERNLDSLITTPRYKLEERISMKSELDVFFNMSPEEQKEILRKILTYRDYMLFKHPEVKAPFITPFKSQTLYVHGLFSIQIHQKNEIKLIYII